ncbi:Dachshund like [Schistosoma japonicum]|nr:Dachshund like [Schistosoma japonicum]
MLDKFTHYKNVLNTDDKLSTDIMDLSSKISSKDSMNFENILALKLCQPDHNSLYLNHNNMNEASNTNDGVQLLSSSSTSSKSLAYCTPNPVPNLPENNHVHFLEYRGAHLAAFTVNGRDLICLPQAFELFLKHLVGGLHTVYTKLKRLDIIPVVCNVEQVRILRGLGAIQPGVNRCKLIAPQEFDILYADCTNSSSRPGRPSKRLAGIETPTPSSVLGSCYDNDSGESTPKQSRNCTNEDDNSGNNKSQPEQTSWPYCAYPLLNSSEFISPLFLKAKVFGHLESVYSSFMKHALLNYQNNLEHEHNSSVSTKHKSVYDGTENVAIPSSGLHRLFTSNVITHSSQHSVTSFLPEDRMNSSIESKTMKNFNQTSNYQQLFDSKLQYFLNQFIEMNYHWKSMHHSKDSSTSVLNSIDSQSKLKLNNYSDYYQHRSNSLFNMNISDSLKYHKSSSPVPTLFSQDSFKEVFQKVMPTTPTNDYCNNDIESFYKPQSSNISNSLEYLEDLKLQKPSSLNFSVEQIKMDPKYPTLHESNHNEEKLCNDNSKCLSFDFKSKEIILRKKNDNCDDKDNEYSDAEEDDVGNNRCDNNEVGKANQNTDISKTLTVLNHYYWWLQCMSHEFPHEKSSTIHESNEPVFADFSSSACYTNNDSLNNNQAL